MWTDLLLMQTATIRPRPTSSFAALITTAVTRGRCLTRNVIMGHNHLLAQSTFISVYGEVNALSSVPLQCQQCNTLANISLESANINK